MEWDSTMKDLEGQEYGAVVGFGLILHEAGEFSTAHEVLDYCLKPHKWQPEYEKWQGFGTPTPGDSESWAQFVEWMDAR